MKKAILITFFLVNQISSQNLDNPLSFVPYFCDKLTKVGNEYFQIFTDIEGFEVAEFYMNPSKSLDVKIMQLKNDRYNELLLSNFITVSDLSTKLYSMLLKKMEINNIKEIEIKLNNKSKVDGFILMSDPNSVTLLDPDFREKYVNSINVLKQNIIIADIDKIVSEGKTQESYFSIIGGIAGLVIGIPVGYTLGKEVNGFNGIGYLFIGPIVGMGIGYLLGYLIGSQSHESITFKINSLEGKRIINKYKILPDGLGCKDIK